jgi:hypothetical protein
MQVETAVSNLRRKLLVYKFSNIGFNVLSSTFSHASWPFEIHELYKQAFSTAQVAHSKVG